MIEEDRRIIEAEIARLEKAYEEAQERYAYTGSASTDKTMHKYQAIRDALEDCLTRNAEASERRLIITQQDQLYRMKEAVGAAYRAQKMDSEVYLKLMDILRG